MVIHFPTRKKFTESKTMKLGISFMVLSFGLGIIDSIWGLYLNSIVNSASLVGIISGVFAILGVISLIFSTSILIRYPETTLWIIASSVLTLSYISFYFINNIYSLIIVGIIVTIMGVIRIQSGGILIRDLANPDNLGQSEGLQFALRNIGWLLGPLMGGFIAADLGIRPVFLFSALFGILAIILFKQIGIKDINRFTEDDGSVKSSLKNLRIYFSDIERIKHYILTGGIYLYWGNIYLFVPILIVEEGLSEFWVGILFFLIALPLVLTEYFDGLLADKFGFKRFFAIGYFILAIGSFISFFIDNPIVWIFILFIASFGAAMLEGNLESYFFKKMDRREEKKFYGPFNTSIFSVSGLGKLIASAVLFFYATQYIFLVIAIEMLIFFFIALSLKTNETSHK